MRYTFKKNKGNTYEIEVSGMWPGKILCPSIRESIAKWRAIVRFLTANNSAVLVKAGGGCALCHSYLDILLIDPCYHCPIFKVTHINKCLSTPFRQRPELRHAEAEVLFLRAILKLNGG